MGRSTLFYKKSAKARKKKNAYQKKYNSSAKEKANRAELGRIRYKAKKDGKNIEGKDASHTKRGIVFKLPSVNRGSKTDSAGDRRARGGKKKK